MPYISLTAGVQDQKAGQKGKKETREVCSILLGLQFCLLGRFPLLRVLNPYLSLLPLLSLQPPWDCLGFGVWENTRGESRVERFPHFLWTHCSLSENESASPGALSDLPVHFWGLDCIAFRLENSRKEMVSSPMIQGYPNSGLLSQPVNNLLFSSQIIPLCMLSRFYSCI